MRAATARCSSATTRVRWAHACSIAASRALIAKLTIHVGLPFEEGPQARPGRPLPGRAFCAQRRKPRMIPKGETRMPRAWHLSRRPKGLPTAEDFELKEVSLPPLEEGMIRLQNRWLSVDPYMRGRMNDVKSYVPPFQLGAPMEGGAIGEIVESKAHGFAPGDLVQHMAGWRDEAVISARGANKVPNLGVEPQRFLGVLGVPGATAWFGLFDVAQAKAGDTVFI